MEGVGCLSCQTLEATVSQLLIQWEATEVNDVTWEDLRGICESYPQFNLEDKVVFDGKGNATCIKKEEELARNSIRREGHVAHDPQSKGDRRSTRLRRENIRLEDYTF